MQQRSVGFADCEALGHVEDPVSWPTCLMQHERKTCSSWGPLTIGDGLGEPSIVTRASELSKACGTNRVFSVKA
jgi:hypothetical protein